MKLTKSQKEVIQEIGTGHIFGIRAQKRNSLWKLEEFGLVERFEIEGQSGYIRLTESGLSELNV